MYKDITIENFRGIEHLKIDGFHQVNLFVGENGCGKSTILEGLFLLTGPTNPGLPLTINSFRSLNITGENLWSLFFNKLNIYSNIEISGELKKPEEKRKLLIKPSIEGTLAATTMEKARIEEKISRAKNSFSTFVPVVNGLQMEYQLTKNGLKPHKPIITKIISDGTNIRFVSPTNNKDKWSLKGIFIDTAPHFANIKMGFNNIQIKKQINEVVEILRRIEPSLNDLRLDAYGTVLCDVGFDQLLPINVMGNGMSRILSIILAILNSESGIVLIDEIDNGFYHSSQDILWDTIFKSAKELNVQIFATTHSIECVKAFSRSYARIIKHNDNMKLYRIEKKSGIHKAISYDYEILKASLDSEWEVR